MGRAFPAPTTGSPEPAYGPFGDSIVVRLMAERDAALAAQSLAERRFNATFAQAPVGIAHVAPDGRFLLVNDKFAAITGYSVEALMEDGFQRITHPDDLESDLAEVGRLLAGLADRYVMEKRYVRPGGGAVWVNLTVALVRDDAGDPDFFVSVIEDVSEMRRAHEQALRDPLTGLYNRRGYMARVEREIARAARECSPLALVYLDLDRFKAVNDAGGHPAGDACLVAVARRLEAQCRPGDVVARLGGDEFAVLMPGLDGAGAMDAAGELRAAIAAMEEPVTGSFGVWAETGCRVTDADAALAAADAAMFVAKRGGRDRVCRGA